MIAKKGFGLTTITWLSDKIGAGLLMRMLVAFGLVKENSMFFVNIRRKAGCSCPGCRSWRDVRDGRTTLEEVGQENVACAYGYVAWRDKAVMSRRIDFARAASLGLLLLFMASLIANPVPAVGLAITTTVGKNDMLTQYFKGSAYTAAWYVGLVDNAGFTAYAAADTMASHGGWAESVAYSNANRVTWTGGTAAAGSIDNSASPAAFNINATATIRGAFMVTDNTKSGTTGVLHSEADFAVARSVISGDTLNVTATESLT